MLEIKQSIMKRKLCKIMCWISIWLFVMKTVECHLAAKWQKTSSCEKWFGTFALIFCFLQIVDHCFLFDRTYQQDAIIVIVN